MPSELDPKTYAITPTDQAIIDSYIEEIIQHGSGDTGAPEFDLIAKLFVYEQGLEWNKLRAREWAKSIQQAMLKAHPETMFDWMVEDRFEMLREQEAFEGAKSVDAWLAEQVEADPDVQKALAVYSTIRAAAEKRIMEAGDGE